jgi:hypothetical protein
MERISIVSIKSTPYLFVGGSTLTYIDETYLGGNFVESLTIPYGCSYFLKDRITSNEVLNFVKANNSYDFFVLNYGFGDSGYEIRNLKIFSIFTPWLKSKYGNLLKIFLYIMFIYRRNISLNTFKSNTNRILQLIPPTATLIFVLNLPTDVSLLKKIARNRYSKHLRIIFSKYDSKNWKILDMSNYTKTYRSSDSHHLNLKGSELLKKAFKEAINSNKK